MTKLLVVPVNKENFIELNNMNVDGFIIGLNKYSVYTDYDLDIEEINELLNLTSKEVYISINKPLHTKDIEELKPIIKELSNLNISGIMFDDIGIINISEGLDLIWNQMHHVTNYETCNFWNKRGVSGAVLSTEIMLEDFINIKKNTNMNIFTYIYGYLPMFESSRELLTNYFEHINLDKTNDIYYLYEKERDKYYHIYEKNNNTYVLEDLIDGIEEINIIKENNIDYIIVNGLLHEPRMFVKIVNSYIEALNGKLNRKSNNKGFLFRETIYKVKNEEK